MRRVFHLAETLFVCALAGALLYGLLWVCYSRLGVAPPPEVGGIAPVSVFPWGVWAAYLLAFAALPAVWEASRRSAGAPPVGFAWPRPLARETMLAVALSLVALAYVVAATAAAHSRLPRALVAGNALFFVVNWAVFAAAEETLFRGFLQRRLARVFRLWLAILLAAALWAFGGHWRSPPLENLYLRLPVGLALGWLYGRSGSLLPPILAHWLINLGVTAGL